MAELIISPSAYADMEEIGDYISGSLHNPAAAQQMIRRFRDAILPLREFPGMGSQLQAEGNERASYRFLVCGSYLIFYHVTADVVCVDRVLYGRRNYTALLFGDRLEDEDE